MQFETRRKLVHIGEGVTAALLVYYDRFPLLFMIVLLAASVAGSVYVKRHHIGVAERLIVLFDRDEHQSTLPGQGSLFLLAGFILSVVLFPEPVALAAILTTTFGDSLNTLVGQRTDQFPNPLNPNKSLMGTCAGFLAAASINTVLLGILPGILISAAAMTVESPNLYIGKWEIDDNLIVPLTVGITHRVLTTVQYLL